MTDSEKLSRQFRDLLEIQENMVEALQDLSPTITVEQPSITVSPPPPAKVEVHPPSVVVEAPQITVSHAKGWTFTITEREYDGRIKTMKATPIE